MIFKLISLGAHKDVAYQNCPTTYSADVSLTFLLTRKPARTELISSAAG